jgi:hypothetical protein
MKAGLLRVYEYYLVRLRHFLPPEHRIAGTKVLDDGGNGGSLIYAVIIEGPMMPDWPDQTVEPERVDFDATMTWWPEDGSVHLTGEWWDGRAKSAPWSIKHWTMAEVEATHISDLLDEFCGKKRNQAT